MGQKSGITNGSYHPRIWKMQWVQQQREWTREQEQKVINKRKLRFAYWMQRNANAMNWLRTVDQLGWERWFDDDANVPNHGTHQQWAHVVEARISDLIGFLPPMRARMRREIFIWEDQLGFFVYSKEVIKDTLYLIEFESFESAESFIKSLPIQNLGYGVVLDILPLQTVLSKESVKA